MKVWFARFVVVCVFACAGLLRYIDRQNQLTKLRLEISNLSSLLRQEEEYRTSLQFAVETLSTPHELLRLSCLNEYQYLGNYQDDVVIVDLKNGD